MFNKIYVNVKEFIILNKYFLLFLIFLIIMLYTPLDYVVYTPGGYITLNDRIEVAEGYDAEGEFNMSYVSVLYASPAIYLLSYLLPNWDLESTENITLENQTMEELEIYQKLNMESSFDYAQIVAFNYAGYPIENIEYNLNIMYIYDYANTELEVGDILLYIEDKEVTSLDVVTEVISTFEVGDEINLVVLRDEEQLEVTASLIEIEESAKIGIVFIVTYEFDTYKEVEFTIDESESGPSGGLLMTLQIYNSLVEEDLTHGLSIAGTGTIDVDGNVGKIDGVKYKILGSKDMDIFFCPEENYEEAIQVVEENDLDIKVVSVSTFEEAVAYLTQL